MIKPEQINGKIMREFGLSL